LNCGWTSGWVNGSDRGEFASIPQIMYKEDNTLLGFGQLFSLPKILEGQEWIRRRAASPAAWVFQRGARVKAIVVDDS
jgi:hypothetical protein